MSPRSPGAVVDDWTDNGTPVPNGSEDPMIFGTTYKCSKQEYRGPDILADSHDHALVRLEFAIAMGWIDETTEIDGELVEVIDCPDEIADAMNPVGRI